MKRSCIFFMVMLLTADPAASQQKFQLAPPLLRYSTVFFKDTVSVEMAFAQKGTAIYYTTNGNEPSVKSKQYTNPVVINKHFTMLKAKVFGKEYLPSETMELTFIQEGLPLQAVTFSAPHSKYSGNGNSNILHDNQGGIPDFTNTNWLGFQQDTVTINIQLQQPMEIQSVLFNMLQHYGSWIFFPSKAVLFAKDEKGMLNKISEMEIMPQQNRKEKKVEAFIFNITEKVKTEYAVLQLHLLKSIPAWHPGGGQPAWMFIDEIKIF